MKRVAVVLAVAGLASTVNALDGGDAYRDGNDNVQLAKAARIRDLVAAYDSRGYLTGSVLVSEHGRVLYEGGAGEANRQTHTLNTANTKFGIASITKQFTAALVLQEVEAGKIRLDGRLGDYLPWYRRDTGGQITIEELLHHTSGLPGDFDEPENSATPAAAMHHEPQEFAQKSCQKNLASQPGAQWAYTNCGYLLLGLVLEKVTGKPYEQLLRERLLDPLGMKDSGMDHNDLARRGGAAGYIRLAGPRYRPGPYIDQGHIFSAGSMYSTVEDLQRWSNALGGSEGVISAAMRAQIFKAGKGDWSYGWFVRKGPNGSTVEEMRGDMPGNYFANIRRYPEQNATIIVLRNGYASPEHFEENVEAILFGGEVKIPRRKPQDLAVTFLLGPGKWAALAVVAGLMAGVSQWRRKRLGGIRAVPC